MTDYNPDSNDSVLAEFEKRVREDTKRIIRYPDEMGPSDSQSGLKKLFTIIVDNLSINERKWKRNMEAYLRDPLNGVPNNTEQHIQVRSAMNKNFVTNPTMSWRVFCRALRFLRIKRFRFSVTLVHNNDITTEHGIWMNLSNSYAHMEEDDDARASYNRVPVIEVRDNSTPVAEPVEVDQVIQSRITTPPPINFDEYRRTYPPVVPESK